MAAYWPISAGPFAGPMNEIPKVYFSRSGASETTRTPFDARAPAPSSIAGDRRGNQELDTARAATGDLREEITRLVIRRRDRRPRGRGVRHQPSGGRAAFGTSLVAEGLIDETGF